MNDTVSPCFGKHLSTITYYLSLYNQRLEMVATMRRGAEFQLSAGLLRRIMCVVYMTRCDMISRNHKQSGSRVRTEREVLGLVQELTRTWTVM